MKKETRPCPECSGDMEEISKRYQKAKRSHNKYRVRKFKCSVCNHEETVYADGEKEERWYN